MIRNLLFSAAIALLIPSLASAAKVEFVGTGIITALNAACKTDGWTVGTRFRFAIRLSGLGSNGANTGFSAIHSTYAQGYNLPGRPKAKFKNATQAHLGSGGFYGTNATRVKKTAMVPAKPKATDDYLNIGLVIEGWSGNPGCTITINAGTIRKR